MDYWDYLGAKDIPWNFTDGPQEVAPSLYFVRSGAEVQNDGGYLAAEDFHDGAKLLGTNRAAGTYAFNRIAYHLAEDADPLVHTLMFGELLNPYAPPIKRRGFVLLGTQAVYETYNKIKKEGLVISGERSVRLIGAVLFDLEADPDEYEEIVDKPEA